MRRIRTSMAERELSLNLSEDAKDLLVDKGWDPAMGARPLRRAIQRYIEDPLADEVLKSSMAPGSTIDVDKAKDGDEREVSITINAPKRKKRQPVGVGAKGGEEAPADEPEGESLPEAEDADIDVLRNPPATEPPADE